MSLPLNATTCFLPSTPLSNTNASNPVFLLCKRELSISLLTCQGCNAFFCLSLILSSLGISEDHFLN
ncbi:hypothetical protein B4082_4495 [Bacillus cereus]|uniref:Uncharacterized protein n=1 Tax=Bacillus cereus TaxID=1396 RepID=A0A164CYC9_BACCE|nr:hypothetical protein B4082_4495 [Bacillus cereus]